MKHTPLHHLHRLGPVLTAGRVSHIQGSMYLQNAHARIPLSADPLPANLLVRVEAEWDGTKLVASRVERAGPETQTLVWDHARARAVRARHEMTRQMRAYFARHDFLEVRTPCWVPEPGTDAHIEPFASPFVEGDVTLPGFLHTSPELSMKRLLVEGFERIVQLTPAWRNGEVTDWHVPEFTILEWYRAWEPVEAIMDDVEDLTRALLSRVARRRSTSSMLPDHDYDLSGRFERISMTEIIERACGFDIREALTLDALREACSRHGLLDFPPLEEDEPDPSDFSNARRETTLQIYKPADDAVSQERDGWDELFFELQVTYIDPLLATMGPVFVTDWPAPLAVLAKRHPDDPRVAKRFELYIGGVELANGFEELTDPLEQRQRFEEDVSQRERLGHQALPLPRAFLGALESGMPPSAGVAMGFDRLLMLAIGARTIQEVTPYSLARDPVNGGFRWG